MKHPLLLAVIVLSACQAAPVRTLGPARLEVAADASARTPGRIDAINGHPAPRGSLLVAPGLLRIDYECPDHVTVDGPISFTATLESGKSYEFYCLGSTPKVRLKQQ